MIVASVLLVVVAGVLLGIGLVQLDESLLYWSIGVSVLAAFTLAVGVRRLVALRAGRGDVVIRLGGAASAAVGEPIKATVIAAGSAAGSTDAGRAAPRPIGRATPRPVGRATPPPQALADHVVDGLVVEDPDLYPPLDADPTAAIEEPDEEIVTASDVERIAGLTNEVLVVDGRPRFHVDGCLHLFGLAPEPLPALEAVELGFTPCGQCRPAAALLRPEQT
jgi:hypothetical protein